VLGNTTEALERRNEVDREKLMGEIGEKEKKLQKAFQEQQKLLKTVNQQKQAANNQVKEKDKISRDLTT
jgi:hypothetical protein